MKNLKRTLSAGLILSMALAQVNIGVLAEEEKLISLPYDMTSFYNSGRIYSGIKTVMGSAGYAGAFYYDDFIGDKYIKWENPWTEGMIDNVLVNEGIPFNMRVIDHKNGADTRSCIWKNSVTTDDEFTDFDVADASYNTLEVLANNDMAGMKRYMVIKLNYTDGTADYSQYELNAFPNSAASQTIGDVSSTRTDPGLPEGEELTKYGHIGHYSIPVDTSKVLDSFSVLNEKYKYEENEAGEISISKIEGEKLSRYSSYPHAAAVYAATLTATNENVKNIYVNQAVKMISELPAELTYDDKASLDKIDIILDKIIELGGTLDDITNYSVLKAAKETIEGLTPVYIPVDLSDLYNESAIYTSNDKRLMKAGCPGSFYYDDFVSDKFIKWKEPWTEGVYENILLSQGTEFKMRVYPHSDAKPMNVVMSNGSKITQPWTNIDMEDMQYNSIQILANSSSASTDTRFLMVKLNYSDGTSELSEKYKTNYFVNPGSSMGIGVISSTRCDPNKGAEANLTGKITHYLIPVNSEKILTSCDVLNFNYNASTDENGNIAVEEAVDDNGNVESHNTSYAMNVYAVTGVTCKQVRKNMIIESIEDAIDNIEMPVTYETKAELDKINKVIEEAKLYNVSTDDIYNYEMFKQYIAMVNQLEPVDVIVDMTDLYNRNHIYRSESSYTGQVQGNAGYAGAFSYEAFKDLSYWMTPWTDGMKINKMLYKDTTFQLKVVDFGKGDKDTSNVVFANNMNGTDKWLNVDVCDSNYSAVKFLANSSYGGSTNGYILSVRLNYKDGFEYVTGELATAFVNSGSLLGCRRYDSDKKAGIKYIEYPVDSSRELVSYDILSFGCTLEENAAAEGGYSVAGEPKKASYGLNIYAMTLVSYKSAVENANQALLNEINEKIDLLTGSAEDYKNYKEVTQLIENAVNNGISKDIIANYPKYAEIGENYVKVKNVSISNNVSDAAAVITFNNAVSEKIINSASFKLMKDGTEADGLKVEKVMENGSAAGVKLSFAHGNAYDSVWEIEVKIGNMIDYVQPIKLIKPFTLENVLYYDNTNTLIPNFTDTDKTFTVTADINKNINDADIYLALYDDKGKLEAVKAVTAENSLSETFTVDAEMNDDWVLKYFVWNNKTMLPYSESKVINKTYGYDNVIDPTKDLRVVYFGDSQTEGKYYTKNLDASLSLQREISGASYTSYNAGVGGTAIHLGMYRLDSDVIAYNPDLVFVEFYPNDWNISGQNKEDNNSKQELANLISYHENVIKRLNALDHVPVIIYMNPMQESENGEISHNSQVVEMLSGLLEHYNIPCMNFDEYARSLIASGEKTWDNFRIAKNNVHFTEEGGKICAEWMYGLLTEQQSEYVRRPVLNASDYQSVKYAAPKLIPVTYAQHDSTWKKLSVDTVTEGYWYPVTGEPFPKGYIASNVNGAEMTFTFKGTSLYVYTLIGPQGGKAEYEIDGVYTGTIDTYTNTKSMYKSAKKVKTGLENKEHTVTLKVTEPNANASGAINFGIGYFMAEE